MRLWESLKVAFAALRANKLRSLLTMLGVIIGVGSVIIMISIVQGARQRVVKDFHGDGTDVVFAFYQPKRSEQRVGGTFEGLTLKDAEIIGRRVDDLGSISPKQETSLKAFHGKKDFAATGEGVTAAYQDVSNVDLAEGRFLTPDDDSGWGKVCVIGDKAKTELFGDKSPLDQEIVLQNGSNRVPMTVVGVLQHKGRGGFGPSIDNQILLPLTTLQKRLLGNDKLSSIDARAGSQGAEASADQIFAVLKTLHPENAQDFVVDTQEGLLQRLDTVLMVFQLILGGVGGLSLLVGGIGIMNIMLVSVTERTREIGIRKAIGAKRRDILLQFVTESMAVSGLGGLVGVAFGYGAATLIGMAAKDQLPTYVPFWAAGLGFGFAVAVGMFFGIYPAVQAARLDPIVALRYE